MEPTPTPSGEPDPAPQRAITVRYTNYRGELSQRRIVPERIWFGSSQWHPRPQWMLEATEPDRGVTRSFALADVVFVEAAEERAADHAAAQFGGMERHHTAPPNEWIRPADAVAPTHVWNDVNNDGLECVDCDGDSIWSFDRNAHANSVLSSTTHGPARSGQDRRGPAPGSTDATTDPCDEGASPHRHLSKADS